MKKRNLSNRNGRASAFAAGMLAMALLTALAMPVLASGETAAYNQVGVRVLGQQMIRAGETCAAPNGQQVPSSITYTDAAGGKTSYLPVRQLAELLDADISWNSEANSVDVGVLPPDPGSIVITAGVGAPPEDPGPAVPEYGRTIGALEEVDPAGVPELKTVTETDPGRCVYYTKNAHVQYGFGGFPEQTVTVDTEYGQYLVYTVTNNGKEPVKITAGRQVTITTGRRELFTTVSLEPGGTLTRVFRVVPDAAPLERTFHFGVVSDSFEREPSTDVTVTLMKLVKPFD